MKKIILVALCILFSTSLFGASLKKVLVLDIININQQTAYDYLETSITEAVVKMLKQQYAFKKMSHYTLKKVAAKNHLYREDFYTKSVAMGLGLLAKQDIVIAGGFKIVTKQTDVKIVTTIKILNIKKKKVISKFTIIGTVDNKIWNVVKKIANRIVVEAKTILPNKKEWERKGLDSSDEGAPIFDNFQIGLRAGAYLFFQGYESYFKPEQPMLGLALKANMPFLWEKLALQANIYFAKKALKTGDGSKLQTLGFQSSSSTYYFAGFLLVDIPIGESFSIAPKAGGGHTYQTTTVSGAQSSTTVNYFPFIAAGFECAYKATDSLSIVLDTQVFLELEDVQTYTTNINVGVNFHL